MPHLIEYSLNELTRENLWIYLNLFIETVIKFNKKEEDKKITDKDNEIKEEANNDIKLKTKIVYEEVESIYNYLKIHQEIITDVDTPSLEQENNNINLSEYEEINDEINENKINNEDILNNSFYT